MFGRTSADEEALKILGHTLFNFQERAHVSKIMIESV